MRIGFIGLGNMGAPMARNLAAAGHAVTGFDTGPVAVEGVAPAASAAEAAARPRRRRHHAPGRRHPPRRLPPRPSPPPRPGTLFLDCSTVDVDSARAAAAEAAQAGLLPLDAPVSGGTAGAAAGTLTFMVGGPRGGLREGPPPPRRHGLPRRPLRPGRRRPGGEDLQQHAPRHLDDRHLRGLRPRPQARPRPARPLRRGLHLLRRLLVGDELLPRPRRRPHLAGRPRLPPRLRRRAHAEGPRASASRPPAAVAAATPLGAHAARLYQDFVAEGGKGRDFSAILPWLAGKAGSE